ncbi:Fic family protein [Metamycoplasma subdolum]|nr:Fic family protein [Metamycoplasma subdolum]WPB50309.1 Fic family protein [Metamycoplasma subdolum]
MNKPVRAIWDYKNSKWWYSAVDIIQIISASKNPRILWNTLKRRNGQLLKFCKQFKLFATDGKKYNSDVICENGIKELGFILKSNSYAKFKKWLEGSNDSIDEQSRRKAYELYKTTLVNDDEIGKTISLVKIHGYLFEGLYNFAGKIRTKTISKGNFTFANGDFLPQILSDLDKMPDSNFDEIVDKYVEMNIAHPFMEGNGRATRIWLDLLLINRINMCIDWSKIEKSDYLEAMIESPNDISKIKNLLKNALTFEINNRELFIKGIDISYYYEEIE